MIGNFVSIYDFKTGNNMADKIGTFIMNHGDQIKTITNSPLDKAKLQLAFYAVIMKLENPNIVTGKQIGRASSRERVSSPV